MCHRITSARRAAVITGCSALALSVAAGQAHAGDIINGTSLLISTTTYQDVGAVAGLVANVSQLPGANAGQTVNAVSNGNLNTVWNNDTVDASFGVTSAITLTDLSLSGSTLATEAINPNLVSTSFSSKSELGLNVAYTSKGAVATFMGYAGGGVGNLDVSNSDSKYYSDPTNPVTSFFGPSYAFNRAVVAVSASGNLTTNSNVSLTQTNAYGGNNGRGAVLLNGSSYTVGNSNNGSAKPIPTQLSQTTGLEVVTPGATTNSTMIDPTYSSVSGDKAGKDSNFRGITQFGGNVYFSKGSGSNGVDTVYTANLTTDKISILPGFPTDPAKPGADYTPFGLFFANPDTLYVADEGSGDQTDAQHNAGLEKWTLSDGAWHLDYTLQDNLIGDIYNVDGWNYTETTSGLRNLTGKINADGTVTLWATTATTSGSGDNGADPNEIVEITDALGDTTLPENEQFSVFDGPQAGLRYGGVAFAAPEPSTWAMMALGFVGLGFLARRGAKARAVAA